MIAEIAKKFIDNKQFLINYLTNNDISSYKDLLIAVLKTINDKFTPDYEGQLFQIDLTDCYQGNYLFIIPFYLIEIEGINEGYDQRCLYVMTNYGSCSGCDSLQAALYDSDEDKIRSLYTLCLHLAQGIKYFTCKEIE